MNGQERAYTGNETLRPARVIGRHPRADEIPLRLPQSRAAVKTADSGQLEDLMSFCMHSRRDFDPAKCLGCYALEELDGQIRGLVKPHSKIARATLRATLADE